MEDSGYFSHRSSDFKCASATGGSGRLPCPDDLFKLSFDDLISSRYSYFRHGFTDEGDFEDFKRELLDFRRLKRQARGVWLSPNDDDDHSPERARRARIGNRNRGSGGGGGEFSDSVKVSDTTVRVSVEERRDERGEADGDEDAGGGRRDAGDGDSGGGRTRRGSGGEDTPVRYTPRVTRSVHLRSYGGGAGARGGCAQNKRNGVYFDDDCFLERSQPRSNPGEACANNARDADDREAAENREGGPAAGTNPPDALLFSAPPERRPARDGARRVSFRETPETILFKEEPSLPRETLTASKHELSSRRGSCSSRNETSLPAKTVSDESNAQGSRYCTIELRSPRSSFALKNESGLPRESVISSDDTCTQRETRKSEVEPRSPRDSLIDEAGLSGRGCDPPGLPVNREGETRSLPQPIVLPIKLVDVPVSRQGSNFQTRVNPENRGRLSESDLAVTSERFVERDPTAAGVSRTAARTLPPRVPVAIPIRVENHTASQRPARNTHNDESGQGKGESDDERVRFRDDRSARDRDDEENRNPVGDREGVEHRHSRTYNPKRSSLLENLKRLSSHGRPRSGRGIDPFMEFFSGDEHFQEFERVFETINNRRVSRDMDLRRQGSWHREGGSEKDSFEEDDLGVLHIDETFLDFFDNDEDFMEFERELEKIKSNRRSRLLDNLNRRSSCDIFSDVMSFCDRSLKGTCTPGSSPKAERRLSAAKSVESELWNSAEEWGMVMNKLKRNSRLFSDQATGGSSGRAADDYVLRSGNSSPQSLDRDVAGHSDQCPCLRGELLI